MSGAKGQVLSPVAGDGFQGRDSPCGAHRQMRGAGAPARTGGAAGTEVQLVVPAIRGNLLFL